MSIKVRKQNAIALIAREIDDMAGDNSCRNCGKKLPEKAPKQQRFCKNKNRCSREAHYLPFRIRDIESKGQRRRKAS